MSLIPANANIAGTTSIADIAWAVKVFIPNLFECVMNQAIFIFYFIWTYCQTFYKIGKQIQIMTSCWMPTLFFTFERKKFTSVLITPTVPISPKIPVSLYNLRIFLKESSAYYSFNLLCWLVHFAPLRKWHVFKTSVHIFDIQVSFLHIPKITFTL
jgi:hypothetical protein